MGPSERAVIGCSGPSACVTLTRAQAGASCCLLPTVCFPLQDQPIASMTAQDKSPLPKPHMVLQYRGQVAITTTGKFKLLSRQVGQTPGVS